MEPTGSSLRLCCPHVPAQMQLPVARAWSSAVGLDQDIYLLGGNSDTQEPASNQCLVWMPSRPQESGDCWYAVSLCR